ncbi:MAG: hypothetical protein BHW06_11280 [Clostridium sp. 44_14]|nr:MAG: hypothetical protein BHW06_11280 [Clostridium sp. 44_14]
MALRNNVLLAVVYLLTIPLVRGIANLDKVHSAECLEQSVILIGIFLMVPLNVPEQSKAIQEVIYARSISHWKILLLRFVMSILLLIMVICLFSGIMIWKNCTFPFTAYVMGTVISAMALGSLGLAVSIWSNSSVAGYLASAGYFLLNSMGSVSDGSIFYLFSMGKGNYMIKLYLLGWSLLVVVISLIYVEKKRDC